MMYNLPGPRRYFNDVANSLTWQKHVVLVMPTRVADHSVTGAIRQVLDDAQLGALTEVDVGPADTENLFEALSGGIASSPRAPATMDELLQHDQCYSRFILVKNGFSKNSQKNMRFNYLIRHAGELSQTIDNLHVQLIVLAKPTDPLPDRNVRLDIHPWWGVLGQIDVDLTVDEHLSRFPPQGVAEELWLRSVCKGVARGAPSLAKMLIESSPMNINEVVDVLRHVYKLRQTNGHDRNFVDTVRPFHYSTPPPPSNQTEKVLWEQETLFWVRGYGLVRHLDAFPEEKRNQEIVRRIWGGEVELLTPVIESVRLDTVDWLKIKMGKRWAEHLSKDAPAVKKESLLSEIGPLSYALMIYAQKNPKTIPRHVARGVEYWKNIRNALAHSKAVDYETIKQSVEHYSKMYEYYNF
jgi:hypothetical protein